MEQLLAHGTSCAALATIAREGLKPRGGSKRNNWTHTVGSNPSCVYLTSGYVLHFATMATNSPEKLALVEVVLDQLNPTSLRCDEDALEQYFRGHPEQEPEQIRKWEMKRRTVWYRSRTHLWRWQDSLTALGTLSHAGTVLPAAFGRVAVITQDASFKLILEYGIDPMISIDNFRYLGKRYEQAQRWLFGDEPDLARSLSDTGFGIGPATGVEGITHYASIDAALDGEYKEKENAVRCE